VKVPNYKVAKLQKLVIFFLRWASSKLSDSLQMAPNGNILH